MELKDRRIQIVIWTNHPFSWNEGGTLVLFYLCKFINDLNHPIFYSKLYLPYEQQKIYPFSNIYYIYDEHEIDDDAFIDPATSRVDCGVVMQIPKRSF